MSETPIAPVAPGEQERVLATLASAFVHDPVERWLYPGEEQYLKSFPRFLAAFGGTAFERRTVWRLGDFDAVAMWLPPGAEPDSDDITAVLGETVAREKHADVFSVLDQMGAAHPDYPHWYLPWFGVDAGLQGRGLGGRLMEVCLGFVDEGHLPAYLETPNPRTIPFYSGHGFEVAGEARSGSCPPVTCMLRSAR